MEVDSQENNKMTEKLKREELSEKQEAFVAAFIKDFNGTKAATEAGYAFPAVEASRLLRLPKIKKRIEEHTEVLRASGIASKTWRIKKLQEVTDKVLDVIEEDGVFQPAYTNQGKEYKKFSNDVLAELRSLMEQAAKEVGDRDKRIQLDADVNVSSEPSESVFDRFQALIDTQGE